ncbi:MAG TPA: glyoxalase superfamily protein [Nocardioides sp.]|jgi:catechol 2,3-dioxygenase-like lactoylglutathione lyase family enzyme|nr:glyoxalase superfamily protein [Nocardioides sp.]
MSDTHKQMARRLRADLADRDISIGHSEALELVAHQHGARDWNTLAATSTGEDSPEGPAVPILRIFDRAKAVEFYVDYLGFAIDWEHGYDDHSPLYMQVHRGRTVLHLSEHHGDASPGGAALIPVADVQALHREVHSRPYDYAKPGVREEDWGRVMVVIDPFHNRLVFHQPVAGADPGEGAAADPRPTEAAAPIELTYDLSCSPDLAWDAFVRRIDTWWHPAYGPPGLREVRIDPLVGAAVTMSLDDGTTYPWGTVTASDQPRHYAQTFTLAQDPEHPSTLDVTFEPHLRGCQVHFEHGGWTAGNVAGRARFSEWSILLDRFAAVAEGRPVPDERLA